MTLVDRDPAAAHDAAVEVRAVLDLIAALRGIPKVRNVLYSSEEGSIDLWVLLETESDDTMAHIADLDYAYRRVPTSAAYNLHVVPLDQVPLEDLPPARPV